MQNFKYYILLNILYIVLKNLDDIHLDYNECRISLQIKELTGTKPYRSNWHLYNAYVNRANGIVKL